MAAERNISTAQCLLGQCYRDGKGVPKDLKEAEKWLIRASQQGDQDAEEALENLPE